MITASIDAMFFIFFPLEKIVGTSGIRIYVIARIEQSIGMWILLAVLDLAKGCLRDSDY